MISLIRQISGEHSLNNCTKLEHVLVKKKKITKKSLVMTMWSLFGLCFLCFVNTVFSINQWEPAFLDDYEHFQKQWHNFTHAIPHSLSQISGERKPKTKRVRRDENHEIYNQKHHMYVCLSPSV